MKIITLNTMVSALADQANFAKNGDIPVTFWGKISAFPQGPVANAVNKILAGADVQSEADKLINRLTDHFRSRKINLFGSSLTSFFRIRL